MFVLGLLEGMPPARTKASNEERCSCNIVRGKYFLNPNQKFFDYFYEKSVICVFKFVTFEQTFFF